MTEPGLRRRSALAAAALVLACGVAAAQPAPPPEVAAALPGARMQGSGSLRVMLLQVYDSTLWVGAQPIGDDWDAVPLALSITYRRDLQGAKIAERSIEEMRRQTEIAAADAARWLVAMKRLFPDVHDGTRITGLNLPGIGARFFVDGVPRGEIADPVFARLFFGIWLSGATSEPALRRALLGRPS